MKKSGLQKFIALFLALTPGVALAEDGEKNAIYVEESRAQNEAKFESQQTTIITEADIEKKQAKSVEEIIFSETGVSRTVDAMGRVGISIRGAEPRHTLLLVDGKPVLGDFAKYYGAVDETMRLGTENIERIEIIQGAASAKYGSDAIGGVVNIITKKAKDKQSLKFNLETRNIKADGAKPKYKNFFFREDAGKIGKVSLGLYGSKRDIMPVYSAKERKKTGISTYVKDFDQNSLRFFGEAMTGGILGSVDIDKKNNIDFRIERYTEDLHRYIKRTDSIMEPMQKYSRKTGRNTAALTYQGRNKDTDYSFELDYARILEDDLTLTSNYGQSSYVGKNMLNYIDNVDHRAINFKATFNTAFNEKHLLTYGYGFSREEGSGSRLKSAKKTYIKKIDPWDYDKSLMVTPKTVPEFGLKKGEIASFIHAHQLAFDKEKGIIWDTDYERYGYEKDKADSYLPKFTFQDYQKYFPDGSTSSNFSSHYELEKDPIASKNYKELNEYILRHNKRRTDTAPVPEWQARYYYEGKYKINGKNFDEVRTSLKNSVIVGEESITKHHFILGDTIAVNENTIFTPILRLDKSSMFGTHITANMGLTQNLNNKGTKRLKFNVGTAYAEPGMGELYYNWEMYGGSPVDEARARLGWYFIGNPNLQPEKSLNFDVALEGENKKTAFRLNAFKNRIKDYLSIYYTGKLIDFHPDVKGAAKIGYPPDMIYSFKNIGTADITGLEGEIRQKFDEHYAMKLGYTYLRAINKSDPTMPRTLLDKPQHKIDLGLDYQNKKSKFRLALWADYYLNMLDSNSVTGGANYMNMDSNLQGGYIFQNSFAKAGSQMYEKKSFGIWNLMLQKGIGKDNLLYFGVDNLFNHRDDDRALHERTYRLGVNFKFDGLVKTKNDKSKEISAKNNVEKTSLSKNHTDNQKDKFKIFGDYEISFVNHGGTNRTPLKTTEDATIGSAEKNMLDKADHQFEQSLRLYLDGELEKNLHMNLGLTASGKKSVSPKEDLAKKKGLNYIRINELALTYHQQNNAYAIGRLREKLGTTGYYFGEHYDGVRSVFKDKATELRIGYGSFKNATGIDDSFYTHATYQTFYRPPTIAEFTGKYRSTLGTADGDPCPVDPKYQNGMINFYQQLISSKEKGEQPQKQLALIKKMYDIATKAYSKDLLKNKYVTTNADELKLTTPLYTYQYIEYGETKTKEMTAWDFLRGLVEKPESPIASWMPKDFQEQIKRENELIREENKKIKALKNAFTLSKTDNADILEKDGKEALQKWWKASKKDALKALEIAAKNNAEENYYTFQKITSSEEEIYDSIYRQNFITESLDDPIDSKHKFSKVVTEYYNAMQKQLSETEYSSLMPREALGRLTGYLIETKGTVLEKDVIPPLERAFFAQVTHKITPSLSLNLFHLNSHKNPKVQILHANQKDNDGYSYTKLANVLAIGFKYQPHRNTTLSLDYGRNSTDFARHLNGKTMYDKNNDDTFTLKGHQKGKIPSFFVLRLGIGKSDLEKRGDYSAFLDYKYFEHGAFFGGNGTDYLPDRYLDGVKSFSFGVNYALEENIFLALSHTFDAKGIGKRDTLYGGENFRVPNFSRVKLTYKF